MADTEKNGSKDTDKPTEAQSPLKPHKDLSVSASDDTHEDDMAAFAETPSSVNTDKSKDIADELDEPSAVAAEDDPTETEPIVPSPQKPYASESTPLGPVTHGFTKPKRRKAKTILVVIVCMLLAASAAAYGTYAYYKKDINKPARVVTQTKVVHEVAPAPTTVAPAVKWDKLGIQYPLNDQTTDWISAQQKVGDDTFVSLSSRKLIEAQLNFVNSQKAPAAEAMTQCAVEKSPLGTLHMYMKNNLPKTVGSVDWITYLAGQKSRNTVAELGDRYVVYQHEQSTCSSDTTVSQLQTTLSNDAAVQSLLKALIVAK